MSGFPDENAPLDGATFTQAYRMIQRAIHDETPKDGFHHLPPEITREPFVPLDKWYSYAMDGDPAELPRGDRGTPWTTLDAIQVDYLQDLTEQLKGISRDLRTHWTGAAAEDYAKYMEVLSGRIDGYVSDQGLVVQARELAYGVFALQIAFKHDLMELARGAYSALRALDHGHALGNLALLTLDVAEAGFSDGVSAIKVGGDVTTRVFKSLVTSIGNYTFAAAREKAQVTGGNPPDIMRSLDTELGKVVAAHARAAQGMSGKLQEFVRHLNNEADEEHYPPIPVVDTSDTKSLKKVFVPR
ncbi:hypothetical protein [Labedaea rhizosphaerae]|uniref:Uncharacterized protein n=1 Tax=Labedaea rhizosphaerae TaxID=598644 RepID=A0A4R6RZ50_LABRH|nr:hypothetical protein [Labedaea rhizosphaerae]TDP91867.1 hypothetical protein EV186_10877 [Labedaea rhizosphaerae]